MLRIPYGKDRLFRKPLCSTADYGSHLTSAPTLAAGDITVGHDRLAPATAAFKAIAFTSGGTGEIRPGDTVTGATSGATAIVIGTVLTSGTWAGGDAAGSLVVRSDSGTFQAENLNTAAQSNIATIGSALPASGIPLFPNNEIVFGVPGSQLLGARGIVRIKDQTATEEWADDGYEFETFDHPLAADPAGCLWAGTAQSVTGTTLVAEASLDGIANPLVADVLVARDAILYIESATTGAGQAVYISSFVHASLTFILQQAFALTPTGTITYKVYTGARAPAHVVSAAAGISLGGGGGGGSMQL